MGKNKYSLVVIGALVVIGLAAFSEEKAYWAFAITYYLMFEILVKLDELQKAVDKLTG